MVQVYKVNISNKSYGLKSIFNSLSITPDLSPGLLSVLDNRALALNLSLLLISNTQIIKLNRIINSESGTNS
jgi:hypothetical protein